MRLHLASVGLQADQCPRDPPPRRLPGRALRTWAGKMRAVSDPQAGSHSLLVSLLFIQILHLVPTFIPTCPGPLGLPAGPCPPPVPSAPLCSISSQISAFVIPQWTFSSVAEVEIGPVVTCTTSPRAHSAPLFQGIITPGNRSSVLRLPSLSPALLWSPGLGTGQGSFGQKGAASSLSACPRRGRPHPHHRACLLPAPSAQIPTQPGMGNRVCSPTAHWA